MKNRILLLSALLSATLILNACSSAKAEEMDASIARLNDPIEAEAIAQAQVHQVGQATYEPYTLERFEQLKGKKPFVLFFHAGWCPTCKKLEEDILADLGNMGPAFILKADYDTELELIKEYGVQAQTTVLLFNKEGEVVKKKLNPSAKFIKDFFTKK